MKKETIQNIRHVVEILTVCVVCFFIGYHTKDYQWRKTSINYGIAGYNRVTGKFEMNEIKKEGYCVNPVNQLPAQVKENKLPVQGIKIN